MQCRRTASLAVDPIWDSLMPAEKRQAGENGVLYAALGIFMRLFGRVIACGICGARTQSHTTSAYSTWSAEL